MLIRSRIFCLNNREVKFSEKVVTIATTLIGIKEISSFLAIPPFAKIRRKINSIAQ